MSPTRLDASLLDEDAVRSVARLQSHGYEAYLVGGCVRDLLLGHRPKDFDIATSARPAGVKRTFARNCRIIGRRFKLAHLHFHGNTKILEVSTFRRAPEPQAAQPDIEEDEDLLITRDNEFGSAEEDAVRRDFTINALFYDPIRDELLDYAGGLPDLERRVVRTIGDPLVRFREDPVRILRAIKFAGRLSLRIDPATEAAMREVAPDLVRSAPPRLLEEILRLLRGGHALDAFLRLRECGALAAILPTVDDYLQAADRDDRVKFWRTLEALDGRAALAQREQRRRWPPENGVLLGALFNRPVQFAAAHTGRRSPTGIAEELISPFATDFRLPRRDTGCLKRICAVQHRFLEDPEHQRYRTDAFLHDPYFVEALELFELSATAEGLPRASVDAWLSRAARPRPARRPLDDLDQDGDFEDGAHEGRAVEEPRSRGSAPAAGRDDDGGSRSKRKRKKRRKEPAKADTPRGEHRRDEPKREPKRKDRKDRNDRKDRKDRKDRRDRGPDRPPARVETIEPEAIDLSAFDVELDPKQVPTFGSIVEGVAKKKRRRVPAADVDDYRPPPPPGEDGPGAPPPPPPASDTPDTFGDW